MMLRALLWMWSTAFAVLILCAAPWSIAHHGGDWQVFVAAGSLVGSHALLDPPQAWQAFFYLPGAAWVFVPVVAVPLAASFVANIAAMLGCAAAAGLVAARIYALPRALAVATFVLWPPVVYAAGIIGQNAPFGLLLAQLSIAGMATRSVALTAVPIGLLLYKPTYAVPFVALLLLRGRWRELGVVGAIGIGWFLLGVPAAGGDWAWPVAWLRLIARFAGGDLGVNGAFALGLPALLARSGLGTAATIAILAFAAAAVAVALRRATAVEAGSAACLAGLALSPHAWAYDAVLALPMIGFAAAALAEPYRTRLLFGLAILSPLLFVSPLLRFDPLTLIVIGGTCVWLTIRLLPAATSSLDAPAVRRYVHEQRRTEFRLEELAR
jgi:hypothetical protein